ncbi:hypothetical protein N7504_007238 [Penicillium tannophilum]|nr:hypothetical protein N7504_007238 [Penicillium tannophilum]
MKPRRESGSSPLGCPYCDRTFTRQEHRERHIHSHTKTKPFTCEVCKRKYGRRDVYQRHLRSQHPEQTSLLAVDKRKGQGACDSCHSRKVKCNSAEHSCERCLREGINCTFLRTLGDQTTHAPSHTNSVQGSIPESSSHANFLDLQGPSSNPAWHQESAGGSQGALLSTPSVNLPFQDVSFAEDFTSGLLDFDFTQTAPYFDFNILDQIPPFPSLDLLPTPPVSERPPESQSSRVKGAYARLQAYTSPTDLSRPASPGAKADHESWLHRLGKKQKVQEVLESALHKWFTSTNEQTPIPTLMLFHMVSLNLHVSVSKIQNLARRHSGEPKPSPATTSSMGTGTLSSTDIFPSKIDQLNALWHAKQIIELAGNLRQDKSNSISIAEGPHFGYCVYFSALTLCAAASLNKAIDVLSASPVQIAKRFIPTLQSLVGNVPG